jgi:hypothetical protein
MQASESSTDIPEQDKVQLVVSDDATADEEPALPRNLKLVGRIVHWNQTPSFSDVAVHLDPREEVRPGQFLARTTGDQATYSYSGG